MRFCLYFAFFFLFVSVITTLVLSRHDAPSGDITTVTGVLKQREAPRGPLPLTPLCPSRSPRRARPGWRNKGMKHGGEVDRLSRDFWRFLRGIFTSLPWFFSRPSLSFSSSSHPFLSKSLCKPSHLPPLTLHLSSSFLSHPFFLFSVLPAGRLFPPPLPLSPCPGGFLNHLNGGGHSNLGFMVIARGSGALGGGGGLEREDVFI